MYLVPNALEVDLSTFSLSALGNSASKHTIRKVEASVIGRKP